MSFNVFNLSEAVANPFNFCVRLIKTILYLYSSIRQLRSCRIKDKSMDDKTILYNNKVITSETTASIAALHDAEAALYASDMNGFTTKNPCQFRNIRIVLLVQQILQSHL